MKKSNSFELDFLVAGVGFEPHDLRVMSPTSYQAALPRDIMVPEAGVEPVRDDKSHGILSPGRLPIPPFRLIKIKLTAYVAYLL